MKQLMRISASKQVALLNYLYYCNLAREYNRPDLVARYNPNPDGPVNEATTKRIDHCAQNIAVALGLTWNDEAYLAEVAR